MKSTSTLLLLVAIIACSLHMISAFNIPQQQSCNLYINSSPYTTRQNTSKLFAGGWGNNQERSVSDEEFGGVNGAPIVTRRRIHITSDSQSTFFVQ